MREVKSLIPFGATPERIRNGIDDLERRRVNTPTFQLSDGTKTVGVFDYLRVSGGSIAAYGTRGVELTISGGQTLTAAGSNFTAAVGSAYLITADSVTATLPASPSEGDVVGPFVADTEARTGFVVGRNGNQIMELSEDMTVDIPSFFFSLVYSTAGGWRIA